MIKDIILNVSRSYTPYTPPKELYGWGGSNNDVLYGANTGVVDPGYGTFARINMTNVSWSLASAGGDFFVVVATNGTIWSWGNDSLAGGNSGFLGHNTTLTRSSPTQIGTLTGWVSASINGHYNTHAIRSNGTLWGWGLNESGELGLSDTIKRSSPTQIGTLTNWKSISHGSLSIKTDGTLWSWGSNFYGNLGLGDTINRSSPVQVGTETNWNYAYSSFVNAGTSFGIKTDGTLWAWGFNGGSFGDGTTAVKYSPVQVGTETYWNKVKCTFFGGGGAVSSYGIKTDGTLWSWGGNLYGQLGLGDTISRSSAVQVGTETNWSDIDFGRNSIYFIKTNGTIWGLGGNNYGVFGNKSTEQVTTPVQIGTLTNWRIPPVDTTDNSVVINTNGEIYTAGDDVLFISRNIAKSSPIQLDNDTNWKIISSGANHNLGIKNNNTLWTWGSNLSENSVKTGQLGTRGTSTINDTRALISPVQIGTLANWSDISAGNYFSLAVKTDGTLWAWGLGTGGQLGLRDLISRSSPVQVGTLANWSKVSAGLLHAHAIKTDGTLWGWGTNTTYPAIGDGTSTSKSSPVQIGTLNNWSIIADGYYSGHAIKTVGTLWAWGGNPQGNLGDDTIVDRNSPVQIGTKTNWNDIAASGYSLYAIDANGSMYSWGQYSTGNLGNFYLKTHFDQSISNLSSVKDDNASIVGSHTIAITTDGSLWSWGLNTSGQLGDGTSTTQYEPIRIGTLTNWTNAYPGRSHTVAIKTDGTMWSWGNNANGQLGLNDLVIRSSPVQIGTLATWTSANTTSTNTFGVKNNGTLWGWGLGTYVPNWFSTSTMAQLGNDIGGWSNIFSGGDNSFRLGVKTNGTLWSWGNNTNGQLGLNASISRSSPVQIGTETNWSKLSTRNNHVTAIKTDGTLWSWGNAGGGSFIGDNTNSLNRSSPVQIGTLNTWSEVAVGGGNSYVIKTDGTLWVWGLASSGTTAQNDTVTRSSPVQIGTETNWYKIAAAGNSPISTKTDGTLWAWGEGTNGIIANSVDNRLPYEISYGYSWNDFSAGRSHTIAIRDNGTLWAWGGNSLGQLGLGDATVRSSPVQIGTLADWLSVSTFDGHNIAIRNDNTMWAWGLGTSGQLGLTGLTSRSSPVQIGTNLWRTVSAGSIHTVAIANDGTLWAWGGNSLGQLGLGDTTTRSSPVQIGTLNDWIKITVGASYTMGIRSNNSLWVWGSNSIGQLGLFLGATARRSSPVQLGTLTWKEISGGISHTIAIRNDNTMWAWGANTSNALGINLANTAHRSSPVQVGTLGTWVSASANLNWSTGLQSNDTRWAWGLNTSGQLGLGDTVTRSSPVQVGSLSWSKVSAGETHSVAKLKSNNKLYTNGNQNGGRLGYEVNWMNNRSSPVQIGTETNWSTVYGGVSSVTAIKTDGTLWQWGVLPLGDNAAVNRSSPVQIGTLTNWLEVNMGNGFTHAIKTDGTLWSWGSNSLGQLGLGNTVVRSSPVQVGTKTNWSKISAGISSVMGLDSVGYLYIAGGNSQGELAYINYSVNNLSSPIQIGVDTNWTSVTTGDSSVMALKSDGTIYAWGVNTTTGQLGLGDVINRSSPVQIGTRSWTSVSMGATHAVGLRSDGTIWSWGAGGGGQLGANIATNRSSPVQIGTRADWKVISAGNLIGHGIRTDGTLWGWGTNTNGAVGDNTTVTKSSPVQVGTLYTWASASSANAYTIGLATDGNLYSVGITTGNGVYYNATNFVNSRSSPVQIGEKRNWLRLAKTGEGTSNGALHMVAIRTDGTLWGWGFNNEGQIGDGTIVNRSSPVQIGSLSTWVSASIGPFHTNAIK